MGEEVPLQDQLEEGFDQVLLVVDQEEQVLQVHDLVARVDVLLRDAAQLHLEEVVNDLMDLVLVEEGLDALLVDVVAAVLVCRINYIGIS